MRTAGYATGRGDVRASSQVLQVDGEFGLQSGDATLHLRGMLVEPHIDSVFDGGKPPLDLPQAVATVHIT